MLDWKVINSYFFLLRSWSFSLFKNNKFGDLTVTEKIKNEILTLPLHSLMNKEDVDYIVKKILEFFKSY